MRFVSPLAMLNAPSTPMVFVAHFFTVILFWLIHAVFANVVEDGMEIFVGFEQTSFVFVRIVHAFEFHSVALGILCAARCIGFSFGQ